MKPVATVPPPNAARVAGEEPVAMSTPTALTFAVLILLSLTLGLAADGTGPARTVIPLVSEAALTQAGGQDETLPVGAKEAAAEPAPLDITQIERIEVIAHGEGQVQVVLIGRDGRQQILNSRVTDQEIAPADGLTEFSAEVIANLSGPDESDGPDADPFGAGLGDPDGGFGGGADAFGSDGTVGDAGAASGLGGIGTDGGTGMGGMMGGFGMGMMGAGDMSSRPRTMRMDQLSPAEQKIEAVLEEMTEVDLIDVPLSDAMDYFADIHNIRIVIDEVALAEIGVPTDEPVNILVSEVSLRSALNQILRPKHLAAIIRDEVLQVTAQEVADAHTETRVYDIRALGSLPGDQLAEIVESSVPGADWESIDGSGGAVSALEGALVVRQTQAAHREIVDLLSQLKRHQELGDRKDPRTSQSAPDVGPLKVRLKDLRFQFDEEGIRVLEAE